MRKVSVIVIAVMVLVAACTPSEKQYTGRLKIDSGTEYVALNSPSPIGGACTGWNALSIQRAGDSASGMLDIVCWRREGDDIVITSKSGAKRTPGPAKAWTD